MRGAAVEGIVCALCLFPSIQITLTILHSQITEQEPRGGTDLRPEFIMDLIQSLP